MGGEADTTARRRFSCGQVSVISRVAGEEGLLSLARPWRLCRMGPPDPRPPCDWESGPQRHAALEGSRLRDDADEIGEEAGEVDVDDDIRVSRLDLSRGASTVEDGHAASPLAGRFNVDPHTA